MIEKITDQILERMSGYTDFVFLLALITILAVCWAIWEHRRANKATRSEISAKGECIKLLLDIVEDQREDLRSFEVGMSLQAAEAHRIGKMYAERAESLRRGANQRDGR